MDSRGHIYDAETIKRMDEAHRQKLDLVAIPQDQEADVRGMNRKARRAWHAQNRQRNGAKWMP